MSAEKKAALAPAIKAVLKKYGVSGTLSVRNHSTLLLKLKSGPIDFIANCNKVCGSSHYQTSRGFRPIMSGYTDINPYWYHEHFDGIAKDFLTEVLHAMNRGNHDNSDIQTDYFDVGWYVDVKIGQWDKPYTVTK
jgi:hypothetical protein